MGRMISVEKSKFTNRNIDIYAKNKVGQYSKFLEKNPIFITYYHINQSASRADVGTGGIQSELGPSSPVRYNKITDFPVYNLPELRPDVNFDESGFDVDLDLSDITILPNTIKPMAGDYFVLSFPGIKEYLFRVNNFRYNTIQSNDFYIIDAELKDIQTDCISAIEPQVIETYTTVFENIGTQDKCFLNNSEVEKVNTLVATFNTMRDFYYNYYYDRLTNSIVFKRDIPNIVGWLYDPYLEAFINKSHIYYEDNTENALVLTPADLIDSHFNYTFSRTLYNAVLNRSTRELMPWQYVVTTPIVKNSSPFYINDIEASSTKLIQTYMESAFTGDETPGPLTPHPIEYTPKCVDPDYFHSLYTGSHIIIALNKEDPSALSYLEMIIYNFMMGIHESISLDDLYKAVNPHTLETFYYLPIVLYIMTIYYTEYFAKDKSYQF